MLYKKELTFVTLLSFFLVVISGCQGYYSVQAASQDQENVQKEEEKARRIIVRWLECDDCSDGEFDAIVELGDEAISTLFAVLESGPSPAKLAQVEQGLKESYREIKDYAETHPKQDIKQSEQEFLTHYQENFTIQYQTRASIALAKIGPNTIEQVKRILSDILDITEREDLRAMLENTIEQLEKNDPEK